MIAWATCSICLSICVDVRVFRMACLYFCLSVFLPICLFLSLSVCINKYKTERERKTNKVVYMYMRIHAVVNVHLPHESGAYHPMHHLQLLFLLFSFLLLLHLIFTAL